MSSLIRKLLREPALRQVELDSPSSTVLQREILLRKPLLAELFNDFYRQCRELDERYFRDTPGRRVELGAGSSLMNRAYPDVVLSDVKPLPFVDLVASGLELPFRSTSLRALYAINVFHHLPDVRLFFEEALRVLHPGGGVVLIEPFYSGVASWLYKRLHATEFFDRSVEEWAYQEAIGPMSKANQALSYIVFVRDRSLYERLFPELEIVYQKPHTQARYFCSGGVNYRCLLPAPLTGLAGILESLLTPFNAFLALQHTVVLRKKGDSPSAEDGSEGAGKADAAVEATLEDRRKLKTQAT